MAVSETLKNQHLLWRAGFGPMAENAADLSKISQKELWLLLLRTSSKQPARLEIATGTIDGLSKGVRDIVQMEQLTREDKKAMRKKSREDLKSLNLQWMEEMINSEAQFRERMSFFWHGHFACRNINIYFQQQLLHVIRANSFGSFGDLLREVSKSPAMLQFLNNQQNRKQKPNENFARELLELFTMGRGNYSEQDVKEAARAFTGWGFNLQGEFVFRKHQHDGGTKTFLGKTGNFNGDDIIDIVLEQESTALYITKKIYRYFVNEKTAEEKVKWLAGRFYKTGYDIKKLMEDIFTSDWFYQEQNIGTKIKSPIDLLVGIRRLLPMELEKDSVQLLFQRLLGQVLFYPPNVAGWPGGKSWIDSSTMMLRLRIPQVITAGAAINIKPKNDDDIMMGQTTDLDVNRSVKAFGGNAGVVDIDWNAVAKIFDKLPRQDLLPGIATTILQTKGRVDNSILERYINTETREMFIKSAMVQIMSTPEYQLC